MKEERHVTKHPWPTLYKYLLVVTEESYEGVSRLQFELEHSGICNWCADGFLTPFLFVMDAQYVFCAQKLIY